MSCFPSVDAEVASPPAPEVGGSGAKNSLFSYLARIQASFSSRVDSGRGLEARDRGEVEDELEEERPPSHIELVSWLPMEVIT